MHPESIPGADHTAYAKVIGYMGEKAVIVLLCPRQSPRPTPAQSAAMDAEQLRMLADEEQRRQEALERQLEAQRLYC